MIKTILDFMGEDHDRLDEIFKEFRVLTDKAAGKGLFHDFKIGLQKHIIWEEEILFPIFENKTGVADSGPTSVMRMEHRKIKDFFGKNTQLPYLRKFYNGFRRRAYRSPYRAQ